MSFRHLVYSAGFLFVTILIIDIVDGAKLCTRGICKGKKADCKKACKVPKGVTIDKRCFKQCIAISNHSPDGVKKCKENCIVVVVPPVDCIWGPWSKDTKCTCCDDCCFRYCLRYRKKKPAQNGGRDCIGQSTDYVIRKCDKTECAKTWENPKRCWGWGDVHYHSFDDLEYNFQGVCKYTLVEDMIGFFKVFVKNRQWANTALSVTQYVEIHLAGDIVRLDGPGSIQVKVNGNPLPAGSLPYNTPWYTANVVGNTMTFESTPLTLTIQFNIHPYNSPPKAPGYGDVYVTLGRQWMQMVDGLCKNYDDNTPNDCSDKAGSSLIGNPNKGELLGISYKVFDPQDPNCVDMLRTLAPTCPTRINAAANQFCGSIVSNVGFFKEVIDMMTNAEIKTWVANCIMDYCAAPDAKCDILEAFVANRRGEGQDMEGWRKMFNCPRQCGPNEVYLYDGPGCEPQCFESELRWCAERRREGCFCKPGYIRCKGKCILFPTAPCPPKSDPRYGPGDPPMMCCMASTWYWPHGKEKYSTQDIPDGKFIHHVCPKGQVFKVFSHYKCGCVDAEQCPPITDPRYGGTPPKMCCKDSTWYWPFGGGSYSTEVIPDGEMISRQCPRGQVFKISSHHKCGCVISVIDCKWGPWSCWRYRPCTRACGGGTRTSTRSRSLLQRGQGPTCNEPSTQSRTSPCNTHACVECPIRPLCRFSCTTSSTLLTLPGTCCPTCFRSCIDRFPRRPTISLRVKAGCSYDFTTKMTFYSTCQNYVPNVCPFTCAHISGTCPSVEPTMGEVRVTSSNNVDINPFTESGKSAGCYNPKSIAKYNWTYNAFSSKGQDTFYLASPGSKDHQEYKVTIY
ncbi:unnamed protein product [Owenia fusiformis]|uniref:VWFD domain-containing protein n=1 Tax=Owenia fusiformis TaxID=6347 RepID=A0A8S4PE25_OWEFU|nr:unnamed protein product [Owenia fusiformis]